MKNGLLSLIHAQYKQLIELLRVNKEVDENTETEKASQNPSDFFQSARDISYPVEIQEDYTEDVDPDEAISTLAHSIRWDSKKEEKDNTSAGSEKTEASEGKSSEINPAKSVADNSEKEVVGSEGIGEEIGEEIAKKEEEKTREYPFPPIVLLDPLNESEGLNEEVLKETAEKLEHILESFGVKSKVTNYTCGPSVTRYEIQPELGVKVSKINALRDELAMHLPVEKIYIEAPLPGKNVIGIELQNQERKLVSFKELIDTDEYERAKEKSLVSFVVGKENGGRSIFGDLEQMVHTLIVGQTGTGKSVLIRSLIMSILYNAGPEDVRMIMIDPKKVELSIFNEIPHLLIPVITDPFKAIGALNWVVEEIDRRYKVFQKYHVRNIQSFNQKVDSTPKEIKESNDDFDFKHMAQIVVIIDEMSGLAELSKEMWMGTIRHLTSAGRTVGVYLVAATNNLSGSVITNDIKANIPSRIAFKVVSGNDSRAVLDSIGAEKLNGIGDILFYYPGITKPIRVQSVYLGDDETERVADYIRDNWGNASYDDSISNHINTDASSGGFSGGASGEDATERFDELFEDAARLVIGKDKASIGNLQRAFRIGFNRAARIMDQLEEYGVVGPEIGTKPRSVLMTMDQFEEMMRRIG